MSDRETILKILDLARWAPSGDNTQPWRFQVDDDNHLVIHGHDTRGWCVYDFNGYASHMAHGALIETIGIAASGHGLDMQWSIRDGSSETRPLYDIFFVDAANGRREGSLRATIEKRSVQRRAMKRRKLSQQEISALTESTGTRYRTRFFQPLRQRISVARLLWGNARIRLISPEAYEVHKRVIQWRERFSEYGIPEQAVGVDPLTARLMQWVMQSWRRVEFFNRYFGGTIVPRIELDLVPALACSAHVLLATDNRLDSLENRVRAGMAMQRFWLTASSLGLQVQPQMTPIIFRWYAHAGESVSHLAGVDSEVKKLAGQLERLADVSENDTLFFFCRIGESRDAISRSLRLPLDELMMWDKPIDGK